MVDIIIDFGLNPDYTKNPHEASTPTWYPPKVPKDTSTGRYNLSKISKSYKG